MNTETPSRAELTKASLVRLSPEDFAEMTAAAQSEDRTLAAWLRHQGRRAVREQEDRAA